MTRGGERERERRRQQEDRKKERKEREPTVKSQRRQMLPTSSLCQCLKAGVRDVLKHACILFFHECDSHEEGGKEQYEREKNGSPHEKSSEVSFFPHPAAASARRLASVTPSCTSATLSGLFSLSGQHGAQQGGEGGPEPREARGPVPQLTPESQGRQVLPAPGRRQRLKTRVRHALHRCCGDWFHNHPLPCHARWEQKEKERERKRAAEPKNREGVRRRKDRGEVYKENNSKKQQQKKRAERGKRAHKEKEAENTRRKREAQARERGTQEKENTEESEHKRRGRKPNKDSNVKLSPHPESASAWKLTSVTPSPITAPQEHPLSHLQKGGQGREEL